VAHILTLETLLKASTLFKQTFDKLVWVEQLKLKDKMKTLYDFVSYLFAVRETC